MGCASIVVSVIVIRERNVVSLSLVVFVLQKEMTAMDSLSFSSSFVVVFGNGEEFWVVVVLSFPMRLFVRWRPSKSKVRLSVCTEKPMHDRPQQQLSLNLVLIRLPPWCDPSSKCCWVFPLTFCAGKR